MSSAGVLYVILNMPLPKIIQYFKKPPPVIPNHELPTLLTQMIEDRTWNQDIDPIVRDLYPTIEDPLMILTSEESIRHTSKIYPTSKKEHASAHEYYGTHTTQRDLPWIDMEKLLFIAVSYEFGGDEAIALDYRNSSDSPSVVASSWTDNVCSWIQIAPSFDHLANKIASV